MPRWCRGLVRQLQHQRHRAVALPRRRLVARQVLVLGPLSLSVRGQPYTLLARRLLLTRLPLPLAAAAHLRRGAVVRLVEVPWVVARCKRVRRKRRTCCLLHRKSSSRPPHQRRLEQQQLGARALLWSRQVRRSLVRAVT